MPSDDQDDPAPPPPAPGETGEPPDRAPPAVSLMITRRQKAALRDLGVSDDEIRHMTPAEAHARLGL